MALGYCPIDQMPFREKLGLQAICRHVTSEAPTSETLTALFKAGK